MNFEILVRYHNRREVAYFENYSMAYITFVALQSVFPEDAEIDLVDNETGEVLKNI